LVVCHILYIHVSCALVSASPSHPHPSLTQPTRSFTPQKHTPDGAYRASPILGAPSSACPDIPPASGCPSTCRQTKCRACRVVKQSVARVAISNTSHEDVANMSRTGRVVYRACVAGVGRRPSRGGRVAVTRGGRVAVTRSVAPPSRVSCCVAAIAAVAARRGRVAASPLVAGVRGCRAAVVVSRWCRGVPWRVAACLGYVTAQRSLAVALLPRGVVCHLSPPRFSVNPRHAMCMRTCTTCTCTCTLIHMHIDTHAH
jgi:hypothetical protein